MKKAFLASSLIALLLPLSYSSASEKAHNPADLSIVKQYYDNKIINDSTLKSKINNELSNYISGVQVYSIYDSMINGYQELHTNKGLLYYNTDKSLLIIGDVFDLKNQKNLTKYSQNIGIINSRLSEIVAEKEMPFQSSINKSLIKNTDVVNVKKREKSFVVPKPIKMPNNEKKAIKNAEKLTQLKKNLRTIIDQGKTRSDEIVEKGSRAVLKNGLTHVKNSQGKSINKIGFDKAGRKLTPVQKKKQISNLVKNTLERPEWYITYPANGIKKDDLIVFSDFSCPWCRKFHKEIPKLNKMGVSVHHMFFQRSFSSGIDTKKSKNDMAILKNVWCSDDPKEALNKLYSGIAPEEAVCTKEQLSSFPSSSHHLLGKVVNVKATPTMINSFGEFIHGYVSAEKYIKFLQGK